MHPYHYALLKADKQTRESVYLKKGVSKYYNFILTISDIDGDTVRDKSRKQQSVIQRYKAIYLLRGLGSYKKSAYKDFNVKRDYSFKYMFSLKEIGQFFLKDHSTIIYGVNKVLGLKKIYPSYREEMDHMERTILEFHTEQILMDQDRAFSKDEKI